MGSNSGNISQAWSQLWSNCNCTPLPVEFLSDALRTYKHLAYQSDEQNRFGKPMVWIGIYIALASLFCILPMVADLVRGLRSRKLWFPCKYFTLNAASLSVIAVAMKLPMDLNNQMPGVVDQSAKIGSMAFMCTIMANLLPSLSAMDSNELLTNIIALGVLVITLVVNVCIQITTGVVSSEGLAPLIHFAGDDTDFDTRYLYKIIAITYVAMLLMLLIIHTCSSLAILNSKQILESKYQAGHETALKDQELQQLGRSTVEKLKQHVSNYCIMAETGSPQFMTACSATTSASGVICAISTAIHILIMLAICLHMKDYESDYKWSTLMILITQFSGVMLGSISPISRCFASLSFKLSIKWIWNHIKVFKVESYWTQTLSDWEQSSVPFAFHSRKCKVVIQKLRILIVSFCIGLQKVVVVACKIIGLVPIFLVILVLFCFRCWKWLKTVFSASGNVPEQNKVLSPYVLQLQDNMNLAERTLKGILKSVNRLIQMAEKQRPTHLMKLLEESRGFEGVEKYNSHRVPSLLAQEFLDCWSLPLVTLATIAISLPKIQNDIVDSLLSGVSEGLVYVTLVEESLNRTDDYVNIQNVAKVLWLEVEIYHKWLGNKLQKHAPQVNTAEQILQWFRDTAKNIVTEVESVDIGGRNDASMCRSISANSMYRITETILFSYDKNIEEVSQEELFEQLSSMISDILAACFTNLPRVIAIKCHTSAIEEREASVHAAAQLLGETTQIINSLEDRELPNLNPNELAFIDKWRAYFHHPFP